MLNITSVFNAILAFFASAADFLFSKGIQIGNFSISFGSLALLLFILYAVFDLLLPWFGDDDEE